MCVFLCTLLSCVQIYHLVLERAHLIVPCRSIKLILAAFHYGVHRSALSTGVIASLRPAAADRASLKRSSKQRWPLYYWGSDTTWFDLIWDNIAVKSKPSPAYESCQTLCETEKGVPLVSHNGCAVFVSATVARDSATAPVIFTVCRGFFTGEPEHADPQRRSMYVLFSRAV